ncbi:MAG TPA: LysR family transcriptional regulator [Phenylobacterium sp.]|nr:LysR family transcriptional regulator [Phenylobacterium sp.]
MSDKAPPFSALRAVEAATRHRSFTWAAKELKITHSAVSQSIRRLEAELGATLFERKGGAMQPSEAALRLAQSYSDAAQALGQAIRDISGTPDATAISLGMSPDFARLWFAAKLSRLNEVLPDVRVDVVTAAGHEGGRDVELLFEFAPRPNDQVLADLTLFPVCTADFARRAALVDVSSILASPLLADHQASWRTWASRLAPRASAPRPHIFDEAAIALESAAQGSGVALAHQFSAEPYLTSGQLVALPFQAPAGEQLVFRSRVTGPKADVIDRLLMWMKLEIGRSAALLRGRLESGR